MRTIRAISALALAAALAGAPAAPALAQEYPPAAPSLTVDKSTVTPTESFTIAGPNFGAGETTTTPGPSQPTAAGRASLTLVESRMPKPALTRTITADAAGNFILTANRAV